MPMPMQAETAPWVHCLPSHAYSGTWAASAAGDNGSGAAVVASLLGPLMPRERHMLDSCFPLPIAVSPSLPHLLPLPLPFSSPQPTSLALPSSTHSCRGGRGARGMGEPIFARPAATRLVSPGQSATARGTQQAETGLEASSPDSQASALSMRPCCLPQKRPLYETHLQRELILCLPIGGPF